MLALAFLGACGADGTGPSTSVIANDALEPGVEGLEYIDTLTAVGIAEPRTWSIVGGSLPSGLTLAPSSGVISGTPTVIESRTFTVAVTGSLGRTASRALAIEIHGVLALATTSVLNGQQGVPYSQALTAIGGDGAYSWSIVGSLAPGLTLSGPTQSILGTPTTMGDFDFTLRVSSGDGQSAQASLAIRVSALPLPPAERCEDYVSTAVASFEDAELASAVRTKLAVGADEPLTCAMLAQVQVLSASSRGLTSLVGIHNLVNLEHLGIALNGLSDIGPLAGLSPTAFTLLDASNNAIDDLSALASLTALDDLHLRENDITDLSPLGALTAMRLLDLHKNPVADIGPLAGMIHLEHLDLWDNSVVDVTPLENLTSLESLNLGHNDVSDITPLGGLSSLTYLNISFNSISDVNPLAGLTELVELYVHDNQVIDITALRDLASLASVGLDTNLGLSDIGPLFDNPGIGAGDQVFLRLTAVPCTDVDALEALGVTVFTECPEP